MKKRLMVIVGVLMLILAWPQKPASAGTSSITVTITLNASPQVDNILPASGSSLPDTPVTFTATYSDLNGWQDLNSTRLLVNTGLDIRNSVYARYDENTQKLYLLNDAGTDWLGGYSPGSNNIIENSYGKLDCSGVVVSGAQTSLTVKWAIVFKSAFAGLEPKNLYLYASDDFNAQSDFIPKGNWFVDNTPPTGAISLNQGSPYTNSSLVTLNLSALDADSGLDKMQFSNDNIVWSDPEAYAATKTWTLSSGYGIKAVYAKFSDKAGNWSGVYSDTIVFGSSNYYLVSWISNSSGKPQETASYKFNLSLSEPAIGLFTSQNYEVKAGFFYSVREEE